MIFEGWCRELCGTEIDEVEYLPETPPHEWTALCLVPKHSLFYEYPLQHISQ